MRTTLRYLTPLIAAAGAAAAILAAPTAVAQPEPPLPSCTDVSGDPVIGRHHDRMRDARQRANQRKSSGRRAGLPVSVG